MSRRRVRFAAWGTGKPSSFQKIVRADTLGRLKRAAGFRRLADEIGVTPAALAHRTALPLGPALDKQVDDDVRMAYAGGALWAGRGDAAAAQGVPATLPIASRSARVITH